MFSRVIYFMTQKKKKVSQIWTNISFNFGTSSSLPRPTTVNQVDDVTNGNIPYIGIFLVIRFSKVQLL